MNILRIIGDYINWIGQNGDLLTLAAFIVFPLLLIGVFWLTYGPQIQQFWKKLSPGTVSFSKALYGGIESILILPWVMTGQINWRDVTSIQARRWGDLLREGYWVVPMRSISEDRRASQTGPPCLERDNSVLVVGQTGAGKTNTFKVLFEQHTLDEHTPVVVFDYKDDYGTFFEEAGYDVLRLSPVRDDTNVTWNIFEEVADEEDIKEIALGITEGLDINTDVDFWEEAGAMLLEAIMKYLFRQCMSETGQPPTNIDLVHYLERNEPEGIYQDLKEHTDLNMPAGSIDPEAKRLGLSVIATMAVDVQRMFFGAFAEAGSFNVREYINNPQGKILLIDLPRQRKASAKPVYQFIIDWAATHALMDDHQSLFLLDEFASIPRLGMIDDLVNRGRSYNTQVMLGVQSLTQVEDTYGHSKANSILSGCTQQILMATNDPQTAEYVQEKVGPDIEGQSMAAYNEDGEVVGRQRREVERYPITRSDVDGFEVGEAVIKTSNGDWVHGIIEAYEDVAESLRSARDYAEEQSLWT